MAAFGYFWPKRIWDKSQFYVPMSKKSEEIKALYLPYARHHKPLLITSRSWIQAIHKDIIFLKNLLKNKEMVFEKGVKNTQAAAYNGARISKVIITLPPIFFLISYLYLRLRFVSNNFWTKIPKSSNTDLEMVFCFQYCSYLLWKKRF
jgi:hypothetical protein